MQTLVIHVKDAPGVLNRVASLLRRRGCNIASLTVGTTERRGVSRMTVVAATDPAGAQRIAAQLRRLVPVLRVEDVTAAPMVARDLAIIKVAATGAERAQVLQLADVFRARVVDVAPGSIVIETTGTEDKIDRLLDVLRPFGVSEMARTGRVAMVRGDGPA